MILEVENSKEEVRTQRDLYFREDSRIHYLDSKSLNMQNEWKNIKECNKYLHDSTYMRMRWPVNDEPLNTFGTLELLFLISKKEFVLVLF